MDLVVLYDIYDLQKIGRNKFRILLLSDLGRETSIIKVQTCEAQTPRQSSWATKLSLYDTSAQVSIFPVVLRISL